MKARNLKLIRATLVCICLAWLTAASKPKKTILYKGIYATLPSDFTVMSDDDIAQKYPTYKKPLAMYTHKSNEADFGVNHTANRWVNKNLEVLRDMYKSTISSVFADVEWFNEGEIREINGRKYVLFEFISELRDERRPNEIATVAKKYTYIAYTVHDNRVLIFNFNGTASQKHVWTPVAESVINSLEINPKLKLPDFEPYRTQGPQPVEPQGRTDTQLEAIKKLNSRKP